MREDTPRRRADVAMIGALLTVAIQAGGLVWGAATLSSAVDQLRDMTTRLEVADQRRSEIIQGLQERVRALEIHAETCRHRLDRIEAQPKGS